MLLLGAGQSGFPTLLGASTPLCWEREHLGARAARWYSKNFSLPLRCLESPALLPRGRSWAEAARARRGDRRAAPGEPRAPLTPFLLVPPQGR